METKTGIERIALERQRQVEEEDWTPEHDDHHCHNELTQAAIAYAVHGISINGQKVNSGFVFFPSEWNYKWWKPEDTNPNHLTLEDRIRHLEKAGALLAAEIDRLQRVQRRNPCP